MTAKRGAFGIIFLFACITIVYGQEPVDISGELKLTPEDCLLVPAGTGGYHLFIRKKPLIESVLITTSSIATWKQEPVKSEAREPAENFGEQEAEEQEAPSLRDLLDSTAEAHERFEQAFEIDIPPNIYIQHNEAWIRVPLAELRHFAIRAFARPGADTSGAFRDSFFVIGEDMHIDEVESPPDAEKKLSLRERLRQRREARSAEGADAAAAADADTTADTDEMSRPLPVTLGVQGGVSLFHPGPDGHMDEASRLTQQLDPVGSVSFSLGLSERMAVNLEVERDSLLMNRFITRAAADWDRLGFEAGFYAGFLNAGPAASAPGLSLIFRGTILPDLLSASFRLDTALGRKITRSGDYRQDYYEFNLGLTPQRFAVGLNISSRNITRKTDLGDISGDWTRYTLSVGYTFPISVTLALDMGYEQLNWVYPPLTYRYDAAYTGIRVSVNIRSRVDLFLNAETPLWPLDYISVPGAPVLLQGTLGVTWKLR